MNNFSGHELTALIVGFFIGMAVASAICVALARAVMRDSWGHVLKTATALEASHARATTSLEHERIVICQHSDRMNAIVEGLLARMQVEVVTGPDPDYAPDYPPDYAPDYAPGTDRVAGHPNPTPEFATVATVVPTAPAANDHAAPARPRRVLDVQEPSPVP